MTALQLSLQHVSPARRSARSSKPNMNNILPYVMLGSRISHCGSGSGARLTTILNIGGSILAKLVPFLFQNSCTSTSSTAAARADRTAAQTPLKTRRGVASHAHSSLYRRRTAPAGECKQFNRHLLRATFARWSHRL